MGMCTSEPLRYTPTNVHENTSWHSKKRSFCGKGIQIIANPSYFSKSKLKTSKKPLDKSHDSIANQKQSLTPGSDDSTKIIDVLLTKQLEKSLESNQQNSFSNVRFLLIDLEKQMDRTSTAMIHILRTTMANYLIRVETFEEFETIRSDKKLRIFLFTTAKYIDLHEEILVDCEKVNVLGTSTKSVTNAFENIHDLIFEVADEFGRYCEWQAYEHDRLGESFLAAQKRELVSDMYNQLMNISTEELTMDKPICTDTSLIWFTKNCNAEKEEKLLRISPSMIVFEHEEHCLVHVRQCGDENAIFLVIDHDSSIISRLEELAQVKHIYHMKDFTNIDQLCFCVTHDLIKHYGQVGEQLKTENRNQEAQQMFLRAQQLCRILFC